LRQPVVWRHGATLDVEVARFSRPDQRRVWYEWIVVHDGVVSPVQNPNGRSYSINL